MAKHKSNFKGIGTLTKMIIYLSLAVVLVFSINAFLFLFFAVLPTIISSFIDKRSEKHVSSTIAAFNLIGVLPFLIKFFFTPALDRYAQSLLGNSEAWMYVYTNVFIGVMIIWCLPQVTSLYYIMAAHKKIKTLKSRQQELEDYWGEKLNPKKF